MKKKPPKTHDQVGRRTLVGGIILGMLTLTSGCALLQSPEESLRERAQAFWNARKIGDDITAYKYESLSKQPNSNLQTYLKAREGIRYHHAEIQTVRLLKPDEAVVEVSITYTIPSIGFHKPIQGKIKDPWIMIDDRWYHDTSRLD